MLEELKKKVLKANLDLVKNGLVIFTWGNVSQRDEETGLVVIKPSGVKYEEMKAEDMVVVDLDGNIIEGQLRPSSDTPTHLELYKAHPSIKGVVHTHSTCATSFAQAGRDIPAYGTTHADYFFGAIPCARSLEEKEVADEYERNTGLVINEHINKKNIDVDAIPAILVRNHGVFAWGHDAFDAVHNATVVEAVAKMALLTELLDKDVKPAPQYLLDKHYKRKHGKNAYYGQKNGRNRK